MYTPLDLVTGDVFTQARAAHRETQFEEGVDHTFTTPAIVAGVLTLNLALSRVFKVSLNAAITSVVVTNVPASRYTIVSIEFTGDGTGRAIAWVNAGVTYHAPDGVFVSPLPATLNKRHKFAIETTDGGTNWDVFLQGLNL